MLLRVVLPAMEGRLQPASLERQPSLLGPSCRQLWCNT